MNWYVVQTQPNRENLAVVNLERQALVWLPCYERLVRHARQACSSSIVSRVFIHQFYPETARWRSVNGTRRQKHC